MDPYAKIVKYLVNPLYLLKDGSIKELKFLQEMETVQFYSRDRIEEMQWERLKLVLDHAYRFCPFYMRRFQAAGLKPGDIKEFRDLEKLPVLTKTDIQNNLSDMISSHFPKEKLIKDKTGGSTGNPLVFYYQRDRLDSRQAATVRHNRWAGYDIGDKVGWIWGAYSDLEGYKRLKARVRNKLLSRLLVLDTSAMTEENIERFVVQLRQYKPKVLLAYTNSLALLAGYLKEKKIDDIRPEGIISTCEVLTPESRALIESVFHCKVFDRYGSREVAVIASECEYHDGMHINSDNLYLEFVNEGKGVSEGEMGDILITDLRNFGMPLIRYKIEDRGAPSSKTCQCGRGLHLMQMMAGRVTDFIVTPTGKIVSGVALATYMITNIEGIRQVQLVQDEIQMLKIKLIRNEKFSEATSNSLLANAEKFLGKGMEFKIEFVDTIPKSPTGKSLFSISRVAPRCIDKPMGTA